jgi:hypothetical protein
MLSQFESRIIDKSTRNGGVLMSFVDYCIAHPSERFYQALLNWSGVSFLWVSNVPFSNSIRIDEGVHIRDPYHWEGRNG